jgi:hypothetical protein
VNKQLLPSSVSSEQTIAQSARKSRRLSPPNLVLPRSKPDPEAVRSAIQDWLVPLLVGEFLTEQDGAGLRGEKTANLAFTTSQCHGERTR